VTVELLKIPAGSNASLTVVYAVLNRFGVGDKPFALDSKMRIVVCTGVGHVHHVMPRDMNVFALAKAGALTSVPSVDLIIGGEERYFVVG
jgi:hypothetical protein